MVPFYEQMLQEARLGHMQWSRREPFSDRQRKALKNADFNVGRSSARWNNAYRHQPQDPRLLHFIYGFTNLIPSSCTDVQILWLIAKRAEEEKNQPEYD